MNYQKFLESKHWESAPAGFDIEPSELPSQLFGFQRECTEWALRRGKAALFCGTGMGKTAMQLAWANCVHQHDGGDVLILAPLAVAGQTVKEGEKFGIDVKQCRSQADVEPGINITNYERLHLFDAEAFTGVVLDESSCLKAYDAKTRTQIIESFGQTPYRLACTATPAPNDFMELGNHAEFFGVMTRTEMLATFFVHDGGDTSKWRLKGHAEETFWKWVSSWAVMLRAPSDLGYNDGPFVLPPLEIHHHIVESPAPSDRLFAVEARTLNERRAARKESLSKRVAEVVEMVKADREPWLVWCDLNAEQDALSKALKDECVSIQGTTPHDNRVSLLELWLVGYKRVLISKPSMFGFGLNLQNCSNIAFVGLSDSWEQYYQAIRRCWRFGQQNTVNVHVVISEAESAVLANIQRKEAEADRMASQMVAQMQQHTLAAMHSTVRESDVYEPRRRMLLPSWLKSEVA